MKLKQKLVALMMIVTLSFIMAGFGGGQAFASSNSASASSDKLQCAVLPQDICGKADDPSGKVENSGIWGLLMLVLNILTTGIGIVATAAIAYAGFKYTTAQNNENQIKEAKDMIRNTIVGIVVYGLMYVGLQFLIPGGVFTS